MLDFLIEQATNCLLDLPQLEAPLQLTLYLIAEFSFSTLFEVETINLFEKFKPHFVDTREYAYGHALSAGILTWNVALMSWIMLVT